MNYISAGTFHRTRMLRRWKRMPAAFMTHFPDSCNFSVKNLKRIPPRYDMQRRPSVLRQQ